MNRHRKSSEPFEILLVEDNSGDIRLTKEILKDCDVASNVAVARDGVEALAFLRRERPYEETTRPDLIFLDLNLPKMDGYQVLAAIKTDTNLKSIPVVILTTTETEEDIIKTYEMNASCYIVKPIDLAGFVRVLKGAINFWFKIVELPGRIKE